MSIVLPPLRSGSCIRLITSPFAFLLLDFSTDLTLEKVEIELRAVSAADWFSLGQNLGIKLPKLREIEKDHHGDVRRCKIEVLDWWYRNAPVPSWESLAHALLRTGGYYGLAQRLRKKGKETCSGCSTYFCSC